MNFSELQEYDRLHVWHPYASMKNPPRPYCVESASGAVLTLADGRKVVDGMSSWWAVAYGYRNPKIDAAVKAQIEKMSHVMFGGLTHEGAVRLAKSLVEMAPKNLDRVFFCDSGSVSVEVAMKMALQFWRARGDSKKTKFATARGGYHGDTWHAMSVCDPVNGMHSLFSGGLPINFFAPRPEIKFGSEWNESDIAPMRELLREHSGEIAAVIIEPIVQGAGGMRFYHPQYLRELRALCDEFSVLLILDEIATGFGRSGKMFACQWA
ncbi:MAG: aminotransferase class III-fold pyridoxal phosphate-dependent enzyme, partial [Opitutales bacterium]|nr:aminotransferase class III-fold pyridoxal phosphate-dependent enzyme [Opitutales bacterium]